VGLTGTCAEWAALGVDEVTQQSSCHVPRLWFKLLGKRTAGVRGCSQPGHMPY
jgi:hypothetical protein